MTSTQTIVWSRAADVFARALDVEGEAREAYVRDACGEDAELHRAVQRLLDAHDELGADENDPALRAWAGAGSDLIDASRLASGTRIGPFRIEEELGIGGMGRVYRATREIDGGVQTVALKLGLFDRLLPQTRQRLRRERRLLATLEHPHIARLIDFGEWTEGQPYFAMEFVDGVPITVYCDRHRLPIRERIRLMLDVLGAVEYAHQRLVLHRDLKAGNVLVDGDGRVKLLDFGIAKPLPSDAGDVAEATLDAQRYFSPATAAPEQITGAATSTASDVYSLGALLFELCTGEPPLPMRDRSPAQFVEDITRTIPPLASQALARLQREQPRQAEQAADARHASGSDMLQRQLRGDLDAVIARTLRKEPTQRYASAEQLAADLRAVLESRPIAARRDERGYRLRKFIRRNAVAVTIGGVALVCALALVAGLVLQSRQLARSRDYADARRAQAEQVTTFLIDLFRAADPKQSRGRDPSARELLARGAERLTGDRVKDAETRAALSAAIAEVYLVRNDYANAERYSATALRLRQGLPQGDPAQLRESYRLHARTAQALGRYAIAESDIARALSSLPKTSDMDAERFDLLGLRASVLQAGGRLEQALALQEQLVRDYTRRFGARDARTRKAQQQLARVLLAAGQDARAEALLETSLAVPTDTDGDDPAVARDLYTLALLRRDQGQFDQAEHMAQAALRIHLQVFGERHSATAGDLSALGTIAQKQGRYPQAVEYFERSLAIKRELNGPRHQRVAAAEYNLGEMLHWSLGDPVAAIEHLQAAVAIAEQTLAPDHLNLAIYRLGLAQALHDLGHDTEARTAAIAARDSFERLPGQVTNLAFARAEILCLRRDGRTATDHADAGRQQLTQALAVIRAEFADTSPRRRRLEDCLGRMQAPVRATQ